ncbi:cobalt-zinc-cadmium resistance protein [Cellulomonas algicola]|uniref:Cobalt-zinc-cadmium resistance protein n=1 Tax=Cellulomonas algicola TaxID=2071633 RepID=A0A401UXZ8_9CELL|nr:cation transporter [Cellulomonas algicola]GCD19553.1 cobalt-zinc-cadmium resistance protein [Cellulomonas algicola]
MADVDAKKVERRALVGSIVGASVIGAAALVWGVVAQSRVLLFDGAFVLLGIVLSALSLAASRAAAIAPSARFPFGRQAVTPIAIAIQGAALLGTLVYAAADAVAIILAGGSDVAAGTVVAYGLLSMVCSIGLVRWLRRTAPASDLVVAEVAQWRAGALLSLVYAAGAGVALLLAVWSLDDVVRYVDPGLVLLACVVLVPIPLRLLRAAGLELMEAAPPTEIATRIDRAVEEVRAEFDLPSPVVRATKLGERLYVEIDFVVAAGGWDVSGEDRVRRALLGRLETLGYELWANVELTTDPELAA